jgi:putative ABC transport system ATP-binding protein
MIAVQNLCFSRPGDRFGLNIPQLQIASGTAAAITGRSGCGKTTLLHLLAGILRPDSGSICVRDRSLETLTEASRRAFRLQNIGLIFQDFQLIDYLSVLENVLLPCRLNPAVNLSQQHRNRASALLANAGLAAHQRHSVTQLSHGERQRVAVCRALLLNPGLLLADEPTGNLDPETSQQILQLLLSQAREHSATLIMVTHDHSLLSQFDQVIAFSDLTCPQVA